MLEKKYDYTPVYGFAPRDKTRFCDADLFGEELWKYVVLKKIKVWWGTPKKTDENIKDKCPLGIQCTYQDVVSGVQKESEQHCGELSSNDIEVKELELKEGDYFSKFNIGFDLTINHLKFTTKKGEFIEFGEVKEEFEKTVLLNETKEPNMIQCFTGYYNSVGLRALGCSFISKKDFIFINLMGVLRFRHVIKINSDEREKWSKKQEIEKLPEDMQVIAKLCLLPDVQFASVMKFCV